jgi:hypothetical protein
MEPSAMFRHLRRAIELSLGEVTVEDKSNFITRSLVRWIAFEAACPGPRG